MTNRDAGDQSIGDLAKQLSEQTSMLVRQELALARSEMQEKGKRFGIGGGLLGAGGLLALYALGFLLGGIALVLIEIGVDAWLAVLIVAAAVALLAGILALKGRKQVRTAVPPVPEQALETSRQDIDHVKESARRP
ncbi:MAG: phage holin family protein [Actinomycetota bacterium]|nr:phage holin family protein [Actinomycetota bacterium]